MGCVYRYIDKRDGIIKYVGIVWGKTRTLEQRHKEHIRNEWWCDDNFVLEYIDENIESRTDAEYYEAHYIALYETYNWYNTSKSGWGISKYLPTKNNWRVFGNTGKNYIPKISDKHLQSKIAYQEYKENIANEIIENIINRIDIIISLLKQEDNIEKAFKIANELFKNKFDSIYDSITKTNENIYNTTFNTDFISSVPTDEKLESIKTDTIISLIKIGISCEKATRYTEYIFKDLYAIKNYEKTLFKDLTRKQKEKKEAQERYNENIRQYLLQKKEQEQKEIEKRNINFVKTYLTNEYMIKKLENKINILVQKTIKKNIVLIICFILASSLLSPNFDTFIGLSICFFGVIIIKLLTKPYNTQKNIRIIKLQLNKYYKYRELNYNKYLLLKENPYIDEYKIFSEIKQMYENKINKKHTKIEERHQNSHEHKFKKIILKQTACKKDINCKTIEEKTLFSDKILNKFKMFCRIIKIFLFYFPGIFFILGGLTQISINDMSYGFLLILFGINLLPITYKKVKTNKIIIRILVSVLLFSIFGCSIAIFDL